MLVGDFNDRHETEEKEIMVCNPTKTIHGNAPGV